MRNFILKVLKYIDEQMFVYYNINKRNIENVLR